MDGNEALLWFWATWEAAQFCVLAKLRTPLGKPQDTFMTIEGAIKAYAAEIKNREQDDARQKSEENNQGNSLSLSLILF